MAPPDADPAGAWMNLFQANRVVQARVEERLEVATDLSWAEFEVLTRLASSPGQRLKMVEIASQLLASKSGVTRLVDRLEGGGLIAREVPVENRRVIYGRITPVGLETLHRARVAFRDALGEAFSRHLSEADVRSLRRILRKLLEGNGAWEDHRCLPEFGDSDPESTCPASSPAGAPVQQ